MKRFVEGTDRQQSTLFPAVLDEYVGEDNPVRAIPGEEFRHQRRRPFARGMPATNSISFSRCSSDRFLCTDVAPRARGYSVLTFDGPGQGAPLREQGLRFTHEWEKPTSAVLDTYLATHARPEKIVLIRLSMGGYLAPRSSRCSTPITTSAAFCRSTSMRWQAASRWR